MVKHNPAYRDGNYVAVATPVPGEENMTPAKPPPRVASTPRAAATPTPVPATERPRRTAALVQAETPAPATSSKLRQSASAAPEPRATGARNASNPSFQHAQEQIIQEVIDHTDPGYVENNLDLSLAKILQRRSGHLPTFPQPAYSCLEGLLSIDQRSNVIVGDQEEGTGCSWSRSTHRAHPLQELGRI